MRDVLDRALKTFIESFLVVFVPELVMVLQNVFEYDWSRWYIWLVPIICGCLGTAISVTWNSIENYLKSKRVAIEAEDKKEE